MYSDCLLIVYLLPVECRIAYSCQTQLTEAIKESSDAQSVLSGIKQARDDLNDELLATKAKAEKKRQSKPEGAKSKADLALELEHALETIAELQQQVGGISELKGQVKSQAAALTELALCRDQVSLHVAFVE